MVRPRRRANIDQVDLRRSQQIGDVSRRADTLHVELHWLVVADVAGDLREVAVKMPSTWVAESRDAGALDLAVSLEVSRRHESEADDSDVNHSGAMTNF